jgi:hypothetical protein
MKKTPFFALLLGVALFFSCNKFKDIVDPEGKNPGKNKPLSGYSNQVILDWNQMTLATMYGPTYDPMIGARIYAMVHIAMHDALNAVAPVYQTYALQAQDQQAEPIAAAAAAAHGVLAASFPAKQAMLDSALTQSLSEVAEGTAKTRGIELGKQAAQIVMALRQNDGAFQNPIHEINPPQEPGVYQPIPPVTFVYGPFWATMQPFGLERPEQFRSAPHPVINSKAYTDDFNEVKSRGDVNSQTRTADQTAYAKFWYEFSEIGWNRVAYTAVSGKKLDILSTARLFALVNIAMVDSYIAGWDAKFHYDFWRPFTAIRAAATDGNDQTEADASWEPLMPTPPVQDYPSTHSALGNAAATVLANVLGDKTRFTMTSTTAEPAGYTRSFQSFSQAALENADSRVMAGIHFRFACNAGLEMGRKVGRWATDNHLRPLAQAKK